MTGLESLINQMKMARDLEHSNIYKHLFEQYGVSTLEDLKAELFDSISLTHKGSSMNVYEGKLKDGVTVSQNDIALICDSNNYGSSLLMQEDGSFKVHVHID